MNRFFGKAQIFSASYMGFAHGLADAQKTMGVITLALVTATAAGTFEKIPDWLGLSPDGQIDGRRAEHRGHQEIPSESRGTRLQRRQRSEKEAAPLRTRRIPRSIPIPRRQSLRRKRAMPKPLHASTASAHATHREILASRGHARVLPKIPIIGSIVAGKHTDWRKTLDGEMTAAAAAGKPPLVAAAGKVRDLSPDVPIWIKIVCSLTMAAGTAAGGWRIIKTLGHKMVKLQPVHGFAAETTAATLLAVTGSFGMTVSTTHSITTAIMGVGCAKRFSALKLSLVERIIWAWVLTLPAAGIVAYLLVKAFRLCGWIP